MSGAGDHKGRPYGIAPHRPVGDGLVPSRCPGAGMSDTGFSSKQDQIVSVDEFRLVHVA